MASNATTPNLTVKHATLKFNPARIEYEVYRTQRTGKKHSWIVPEEYFDIFLVLLESNPEIAAKLSDDEVDLSVWSELVNVSNNSRQEYFWYRIEDKDYRKFYTDEIDRIKFPKISATHRNDNNV